MVCRVDNTQLTEVDLQLNVRYGGKGKYEVHSDNAGQATGKLWWNNVAYWDNVPHNVWTFTIGGYPVLKKWLDYRHVEKLGRSLYPEEIRYVTEMIQRIATLISLHATLSENFFAIKDNALSIPQNHRS